MGGQMFEAEGRLNGFLMNPDVLVIADEGPLSDERTNIPLDEALVRNVMALGVREPIFVRKSATGQPEVVDGRQRVRAAREANKRLVAAGGEPRMVPVLAAKGEDSEMFELMVGLNYHIEESPLVKAAKLQRYLAAGHTEKQAQVVFCLTSEASGRQLLALLDTPKKVQAAVASGKLSVSAAAKMAGMSPDKAAEVLAKLAEGPAAPRSKGKHTVKQVEDAVKGEVGLKPPSRRTLGKAWESLARERVVLSKDAQDVLVWAATGEVRGCVIGLLEEEKE